LFPSLTSLRLTGEFNPLPNWTNIWTLLSLRNSYISGTLPTTMGFSTTNLVTVDIAVNNFGGNIPPIFFNPYGWLFFYYYYYFISLIC
jgi:hypothetical protein